MGTPEKKIGIYSPYFENFGGGEKYLFSIARSLMGKYGIDIFSKDISYKAKEFFGMETDGIVFRNPHELSGQSVLKRLALLFRYSLFFHTTDGSLFFSTAGKNFLVIQSPMHIPEKNFLNSIKLLNWKIICYSEFIREIIMKRLGKNAHVLPPAIDTEMFRKRGVKKNIILSVGRFFLHPHNKKHQEMAEIFIRNHDRFFKGYRLVIAGGMNEKEGEMIVGKIKRICKGYPVEVIVNPSLDILASLYSESRIYWHAAGFGEDESVHPERMEHFGMTTLEAMASGCVPVVINKGGQKELVENGFNGYLWDNEDDLVYNTLKILKNNNLEKLLSQRAIRRAEDFSYEKFILRLKNCISK